MKKTLITLCASMFLLAACGTGGHGCDDCEKMARDAKAQHEMKKDKDGKKHGCKCAEGKPCSKKAK